MKGSVELRLSTDDDGFMSQECPACERRFKVVFGEGSGKSIGFCPYCGHEGQDCWWTPEQADYIGDVVAAEVVGPEFEQMAREFNSGSSSGFIRMTVEVERQSMPRQPDEPNEPMPVLLFSCCNERIKHNGSLDELHCIICGRKTAVV
jgi:ribosomal protein S27E